VNLPRANSPNSRPVRRIGKAAGGKEANSGKPSEPSGEFTVFLDRDGVFNVNPPVGLRLYRNLVWLPGAREAFARLNRPGIQTCLCTNQPWVGLLTATPGMISRLHVRFSAELEKHGGKLHRIEAAHGHPLFRFRRTKPRPGMLEDGAAALAAAGHPVDKARAVMVGDKLKDAQAAAAYGVPAILLATTYPAQSLAARAAAKGVPYAAIVPDLAAAVDLVLAWAARPGPVKV
jgi:D-glycero-D-manno-heptose 1,7-bisphosphate phosphatase